MGLVASLQHIKNNTDVEELNRYGGDRKIVVDGSLSEIITQALNIAHSRRDMTTGEPFYGASDESGSPIQGAGGIGNIMNADSPNTRAPVRPTLESMQQDNDDVTTVLAAALSDAVNAKQEGAMSGKPVVVYAIPENGFVSEEMNEDIEAYDKSGGVDINDFVFVYTDKAHNNNVDYTVVDVNQKVRDYEDRGAKVFQSLESFVSALPELRRK